MAHTYNPSTWEAEAEGSPWVQGQPGVHNQVQSQSELQSKTGSLENVNPLLTAERCIHTCGLVTGLKT